MKHSLFILLVVMGACASPALADCTTTAPMPVQTCVNPVGSIGYSFCDSMDALETAYNQFVTASNQLCSMERDAMRFATIPTRFQTQIQGDLAQVTSLVNQVQGLSFTDQQIQATFARLMPSYQTGMQLSSYEAQLRQATQVSLLNGLTDAGFEISTQDRDANLVQELRDQASEATGPTQATQMLAQLVAVLTEQVAKEQRLSAAGITSMASYFLQNQQLAGASSASTTQAAQMAISQLSVSIPTPTQLSAMIRQAQASAAR